LHRIPCMTSLTPPALLAPPPNALRGISWVMIGMIFFVMQDVTMKALLVAYPIWMLIFVRSVVAVIVLVPLILFLGGSHRLLSPLWRLHLIRGLLFVIGFSLFYTAFPFMALAEVTTIFFSAPLFTALLAVFWLKESIGAHRVTALVLGFSGVLVSVNPTGENFTWVAVLPLICAVTYSVSQILARKIGEAESPLTVGLQTLTFAGIAILPIGWLTSVVVGRIIEVDHLRFAFPLDQPGDWPLLLLLGTAGMIGWMLLSRAYQITNASLLAPFDYTYLPLIALVAYLLWGEVPPWNTLAGMTLIVIGGIYLGYREWRAVKDTNDPAIVAETLYAPGNPIPAAPESDDEFTTDTESARHDNA